MDLIIFVNDQEQFFNQLNAIAGNPENELFDLVAVDDDDEEPQAVLNVPTTPVYMNDESKLLFVTRSVTREQAELLTSVQVLGEVSGGDYVFDSPATQAIYESNYDTEPRMIDDGEGGEIEYTPPYKLGVFL